MVFTFHIYLNSAQRRGCNIRYVYLETLYFRSLPKSASFDESQSALDVVRTKRAKQQLSEKVSRQQQQAATARTTKSGLSGDRERTVGCSDIVAGVAELSKEKVARAGSRTPTPHPSRPVTPVAPPQDPAPSLLLSPETALPPPPSPPCTCGKVLGDMGPPPDTDWDRHSVDSKGTLGSRRSQVYSSPILTSVYTHVTLLQGYVSMTSASTYLIDATGADPVVVQGAAPPPLYPRPEPGYPAPAPGPGHDPYHNGYALDGGLASHATAHLVASR